MYSNNSQWFSQALLTYKDKTYATDGYLRVSLSTSTDDFKFFNQPMINISISNNFQKSINLNIQNSRDLIRAFKQVLQQLNGKEINIQRKYQKDTILHFTFKLDQNETRIVVIEIRNNDTDFTKIVIPLESVFESFASCIREFTESYMNICTQLFMQSIQSQSTQVVHQLPSLIKGISSQIVEYQPISQDNIPDHGARPHEASSAPEADIQKMTATIEDLNKFMGDDMENISIPEIEKAEKKEKEQNILEIDSMFVSKFLENDLQVLENKIANYFTAASPINAFCDDILTNLGQYYGDDFKCLPNINDDDMKSIVYISKMISSLTYFNYFAGNPVPASSPVLKYNAKTFDDNNLEMAYDLFTFNLYLRIFRRRMENKTSDAESSKAIFYNNLRCFTDPLVFSFLDKVDKSKLASNILNRYKYYNKIGVFDCYKILLDDAKCPEILDGDIVSVVEEAIEKVVGTSPYINVIHDEAYQGNNFRVETKNSFNLEQIINEILPLELAEKSGKDLTVKETMKELQEKHSISEQIVRIFQGKEKPKKVSKLKTTSNLERVIRSMFIDEVPEQYKESFLEYLVELGDKPFDLKTSTYPIDEFGDNVVKALYLWTPDEDPTVAKNYKQFFLKIENELMDRDMILTKMKSFEEDSEGDAQWNFLGEI